MTKGANWLSDTARDVLRYGIEGITIKDLVDAFENKYKSRDACWAALSRLTKKLNAQGYITLLGGRRTRSLITTIKGKDQIKRDLSLKLPTQARLRLHGKKSATLDSTNKLEELLLEVLAKYGELTIQDLATSLQVEETKISNIVQQLWEKRILFKATKTIGQVEVQLFYLNWKLAHEPLHKIISSDSNEDV